MKDFVVKKIKSLKRIRPDSSWLLNQKSFLLSEISRDEKKETKPSLVLPLFNFNVLKIFKPSFAIALATIILITSLATVGVIWAAQDSLSGDFLYPVKTALEQTRLTFTPGQENKTKLSIKLATERMDEFTQLINEPEKKQDMEKTIKNFTAQIVSVRENVDKLRAEGKAEVLRLVKAQTSIYQETLIESSDKLAYIFPEGKEDLKKNIDEALIEVSKTEEMSEELIGEEETDSPYAPEGASEDKEDIVIPAEEEGVESPSMDFENLNEELLPQEEE